MYGNKSRENISLSRTLYRYGNIVVHLYVVYFRCPQLMQTRVFQGDTSLLMNLTVLIPPQHITHAVHSCSSVCSLRSSSICDPLTRIGQTLSPVGTRAHTIAIKSKLMEPINFSCGHLWFPIVLSFYWVKMDWCSLLIS